MSLSASLQRRLVLVSLTVNIASLPDRTELSERSPAGSDASRVSSSEKLLNVRILLSVGFPSVRGPVLSSAIAVPLRAGSRYTPPLLQIPFSAALRLQVT